MHIDLRWKSVDSDIAPSLVIVCGMVGERRQDRVYLTFQIEMPASLAWNLAIALDLAALALVATQASSVSYELPNSVSVKRTKRDFDTTLSVEANKNRRSKNPRLSASDRIRT